MLFDQVPLGFWVSTLCDWLVVAEVAKFVSVSAGTPSLKEQFQMILNAPSFRIQYYQTDQDIHNIDFPVYFREIMKWKNNNLIKGNLYFQFNEEKLVEFVGSNFAAIAPSVSTVHLKWILLAMNQASPKEFDSFLGKFENVTALVTDQCSAISDKIVDLMNTAIMMKKLTKLKLFNCDYDSITRKFFVFLGLNCINLTEFSLTYSGYGFDEKNDDGTSALLDLLRQNKYLTHVTLEIFDKYCNAVLVNLSADYRINCLLCIDLTVMGDANLDPTLIVSLVLESNVLKEFKVYCASPNLYLRDFSFEYSLVSSSTTSAYKKDIEICFQRETPGELFQDDIGRIQLLRLFKNCVDLTGIKLAHMKVPAELFHIIATRNKSTLNMFNLTEPRLFYTDEIHGLYTEDEEAQQDAVIMENCRAIYRQCPLVKKKNGGEMILNGVQLPVERNDEEGTARYPQQWEQED